VRKLLKAFPIFLFLVLHFVFLLLLFLENRNAPRILIFLAGITVLLGIFYSKKFKADTSGFKTTDLLLVIFSILGAVTTYWLNSQFQVGAVMAAGLVGFVSSFVPFLKRRSDLLREFPAAMYCGSFVGMTAPFIANGYLFVCFAGLISGIILILSKSTLHGFGGKFGTIAFGGVSITVFLLFLMSLVWK